MLDDVLKEASEQGISQAGMLYMLCRHLGADPASAGFSPFVLRSLDDQTSRFFVDGALVIPERRTAIQEIESIVDSIKVKPRAVRKAAPSKPPRRRSGYLGPTETDPSEWATRHLLDFFTILWFENGYKMSVPKWQPKDRANAKRLLGEYGSGIKDYMQFSFKNWKPLSTKLRIDGLPSLSILWGYRSSIAAYVSGDVQLAGSNWGSSHNSDQSRDSGDEIGW
jgi:hypothetical protein